MAQLLFETDEQRFVRCYNDAKGYHRRASLLAAQNRSASLVFNVAAIAVECYLIALCSLHGDMPFNHNYRSLMASASEKSTFSHSLRDSILSLDSIFGICSVDDYHHGTPDEHDKVRILSICQALDVLITSEQRRLQEEKS
ncbi:hypothetical protein SAMN05192562_107152 [Kosakonia arachidis]|uniref:HEPN domain-containing protein n=1 Tax=Kosakonia arachidis TaxID=551989 RepID=A0A1I7DXR0_9ENTR|nr:hypothetical protein [Kosakonia arachidis]SFU16477.1 hypothetical protein SAMN05192562_107152 [Kosakonia arachidis]